MKLIAKSERIYLRELTVSDALPFYNLNNDIEVLKYTGDKPLGNKTSGLGIDLRTNKGYVVWYHDKDIRDCINEINKTSQNLNKWLEKLFSYTT